MSLWSAIRTALRPDAAPDDRTLAVLLEQRAAIAGTLPSWRAGKPTWPERSIETYTIEYAKLALIFRLVGITATSVGAAPVRVYAEDAEGALTPLPRHPMRQLMARPNPQMRESRFLATVTMIASVAGFCLVEKERSAGGRVVGLWPLRSDWAKPVPRTNAPPDWEYTVPGHRPVTLAATDVLHFTYADRPDGSPFGLGALEIALREVGLLNVMTDFLKAFFDTGAMPQTALIPQEGATLKPGDAELIRETWRRRYGGLLNSVDPAILVGIKDIKRLSFDFDELAFTDLRDISELALCQAFGVPPILAGVRYGLERSTFANYGEARRSFYEDSISPLWARFDDVLTLGLLPEFDASPNVALQFDTSDIPALQEDRNTRATWLTQAYLGGGISAHVYHQELGLPAPPVDFYLRGFTVDAIPADDPLGLRQAPKPVVTVQPPKALPAGDDAEVPQDPTEEDEERARRIVRERRGRVAPRERRAAIGTLNRRHVKRIAETAQPWVSAYFRQAGERILGSVRSGTGPHEMRAMVLVDWDEEERELARVLARLFQLSGETAYGAIEEQLGVSLSFDLANPNLADVRHLLAQQVTQITDESRAQIQDVVTRALDDGKTLDELTADLRAKFDGWTDHRARTVSRTESMLSYNLATLTGTAESGVCDRMQFFDNPDHDTDPGSDGLTCAQRNGLVVPLAEAQRHIEAEHPNGTLASAGVLIGEEV